MQELGHDSIGIELELVPGRTIGLLLSPLHHFANVLWWYCSDIWHTSRPKLAEDSPPRKFRPKVLEAKLAVIQLTVVWPQQDS